MTIGEKIKKVRKLKGLSRSELAFLCGMSEYTIRSYEQGIRTPSDSQLDKIALALEVDIHAISNPSLDSRIGVAHTLFELEEQFGLTVTKYEGLIVIRPEQYTGTYDFLSSWCNMKEKMINGEITQEEYDMWRYNYPKSQAEIWHERLKKKREEMKHNKKDTSDS